MCCDDYDGRSVHTLRAKLCKKFVITDEEEMCRKFYVNIAQFQERNQEIALCKILIHLSSKGLTINNRKFYMPKFNAIIETKSFCRIKLSALNQKQVILKSYPRNRDYQEIIRENTEFQPIVLFPSKAFKPFGSPGFDLFSMNQDFFNMTQTFNSDPVGSDCCCLNGYCTDSIQDRIICPKRDSNEQIEHSFLYLQQEIRNQFLESDMKNQGTEVIKLEEIKEVQDQQKMSREDKEDGSQKQWSQSKIKTEESFKRQKSQEGEKREDSFPFIQNKQPSSLEVKLENNNPQGIKSDEPKRRTREPQRKVAEVIMLTKLWRQLHERKGWSLIDASKLVGISKKSLDDYFLVLRIGVIHNYDYAGSLAQGMGDLRAFIKQKDTKVSGKLNKRVQCFALVPQLNLDLIIEEYKRGQGLKLLI